MTGINAVSYRSRFLKYMHDGLHQVVKACQVLAEAQSRLTQNEFMSLCRDLKLAPRTRERLVRIGNYKPFRDAKVQKQLPLSWGTLDRLASMKESAFRSALDAGKIKPNLTRRGAHAIEQGKHVEVLKKVVKPKVKDTAELLTGERLLLSVAFHKDMLDEEIAVQVLEEIREKIEDLKDHFQLIQIKLIDYGLPALIAAENDVLFSEAGMAKSRREVERLGRAAENAILILSRIVRREARRQRKAASLGDRTLAKKGQLKRAWTAEEIVQCEADEDSVRYAWEELDIGLDIDECLRNPEVAVKWDKKRDSSSDFKW
jgi:hypothetical protein